MSVKEPSKAMNSYFGRLLNGNILFRWEVLVLEENLNEEDDEKVDEEFSFFNFVSQLVESHRAYMKKDFDTALKLMEVLEKDIEVVHQNPNGRFFSIYNAMKHIIDISMITLLLMTNKDEQCLTALHSLYLSGELNEREEAAILAIRSSCSAMYSYDGVQEALDFIGRAIRKDPDFPFWRFLRATYLYKLRTISNPKDAPTLEEMDLFKKVNEEEQNDPLFMVYLADVYRESASANNPKKFKFWFVPEESKNDSKQEIDNMFKEAKKLYEKAHQMRQNCPKIAFRCALGLMKLPQFFQNVKLAKQIILDLIPDNEKSGLGNCVAAYYYHRFGQKPDLVKKYLKMAMELTVFTANMNYVSLSFRENSKECVEHLKKMLDIFEEAPKRKLIYSQILSYHLFAISKSNISNDDLLLICDYLISYLKLGGSRNSLEYHHSLFIETNEAISLLDVVTDEVKHARCNQRLEPEFRQELDKFVHSLNFFNICAWKGRWQNLRGSILNGKIPEPESRCLRSSHPTNRSAPANNSPQNFNSKEQYPNKWSGPRNQAGSIRGKSQRGQPQKGFARGQPQAGFARGQPQAGFARGQPQAGFARGQPQAGFARGQSQAGFARGQSQAGYGRGQHESQPVGAPGKERGPVLPGSNVLSKEKRNDVLEIPTNNVEKGNSVKTKQRENAVKTEQVNPEVRSFPTDGRKYGDYIGKENSGRNREEYRHVHRLSRDDRYASSSERSLRRRRKYHSESSLTDDSYNRYRKRNHRRRSRSSDSYDHKDSRHRRKARECRESYDKYRKHGRRHSSVSSDSGSRYRKYESKSHRHNRYRSVTPADSVFSKYEKKKSSRRARRRSSSESEFSDRHRGYKKRSHRHSVTPSGSVSSRYENKKSSRRTKGRSASGSGSRGRYRKSGKEIRRRYDDRSITPSGSVSSKYGNKKSSRRTKDRSPSETRSPEKYRKREKESRRRYDDRSITPSGSVSSKKENKKSSRRTKDESPSRDQISSASGSPERYQKREKESRRRHDDRSITPSGSVSSKKENTKSSRRTEDQSPSKDQIPSKSGSPERYRKREKESRKRHEDRSITPSGSVASKSGNKKPSRRTKDQSPSESGSPERYRKHEKESRRRHDDRSITPSGSISSKYEDRKPSRRTRDRSLSESWSPERYRKSGKESRRRHRDRSHTPPGRVSSKYENTKPSRRTKDQSPSESGSPERNRKHEKESHRSRHHSVTSSEGESAACEKRKSNRHDKDRKDRERHQKSEENDKYLSKKVGDMSLDGEKRSSVQRDVERVRDPDPKEAQ